MKAVGKMDKLLFGVIILLVLYYGVSEGLKIAYDSGLMGMLLTGFISFVITGVIMSVANAIFGFWFGKTGGVILFAVNCFWIGNIIF